MEGESGFSSVGRNFLGGRAAARRAELPSSSGLRALGLGGSARGWTRGPEALDSGCWEPVVPWAVRPHLC